MFVEVCQCGNRVRSQLSGDVVVCSRCNLRIAIGSVTASMDYKSKVSAWGVIHSYAPTNATKWNPATARQWYDTEWTPLIPSCGECRQHWAELTKQHPPDFSSARAFFEWAWSRHNDVSTMHSKRPTITLKEAYTVYWS